MANADLRKFLEDRLSALDPGVDLSAGSPAQTKFIAPVLTYLGTDPFETDIDKFITDRFAQDFPDIYASDPGALRDVFVKPLQLILEPFKRETASIRRAQSLVDPTLLSDDDADALVANVFDSRDSGGYAVGQVRLYFPNPADMRVEVGNMVYSRSNLNFFPTSSVAISAESMVFNREGALFYLDVPVRAEKPGASYNVEVDDIVGIQGIPNVVRATNLRKFTGGAERQETPEFVAAAEGSLTERSLANRRGTVARLFNVFKGQLRAVQVVGAKDAEMQRDILVATSPGHAWITGEVEIYKGVAYVRAMTLEGSESDVPKPGDALYFYVDRTQPEFNSLTQEQRFVRLQVEETYFSQRAASPPYQLAYFVRWSDPDANLPTSISDSLPRAFSGGFSKKGTIKISSLPDIGKLSPEGVVNNQEVHVYGRSDVYVRPTSQNTTKVVLDGAYDMGKSGSTEVNPHFYLERHTLVATGGSNAVTDVSLVDGEPTPFDFKTAGVEPGDLLSIEEGADAGLYTIGDITYDANDTCVLWLDGALRTSSKNTDTTGSGRYRILKKIRINLFEPRVMRFPFGDAIQRDLRTTIGSDFVRLANNDLLRYGAKIGDSLRILEGSDAGDYTIIAFDATLGGQGIFLDRKLTSTAVDLPIEVFAALNPVERPLVRVREILLLDSAKQSTGLTIPAADPVAVVPTGNLTSAKVLGQSQLASAYVLPDLSGIIDGLTNQAAASGDRRYSLNFDQADGVYISVTSPLGQAELDLRSDTSGKCSFVMLTVESDGDEVNYPPADPKPGDCLSLKNGPNKGDYLIKAVHKFKYGKNVYVGSGDGGADVTRTCHVYFVQIYGTFPVDPLKEIWKFLETYGMGGGLDLSAFPITFPDFFVDWYKNLGGALSDALRSWGISEPPTAQELQAVVESMSASLYEWGAPARGVFRTYFREPTLFEQRTALADVVTTYSYKTSTGQLMKYRADPVRYGAYEIVPPRLTTDAQPTEYPRGLSVEDTGDGFKVSFTGDAQESVFAMGVTEGDFVSVHHEVPLADEALKTAAIVVQTVAGTTRLTLPSCMTDYAFSPAMVGNLLFIEEGVDAGGYHVTSVAVDGMSLTVDRVLSSTTSTIKKQGALGTYYFDPAGDGTNIIINNGGAVFEMADVGSYITIFNADEQYMGSFMISGLLNQNSASGLASTVVVDVPATTQFENPGNPCAWAITDAPTTSLDRVGRGSIATATGTETLAGVPIRMYEAKPVDLRVSQVAREPGASYVFIDGTIPDRIRQPYRIYRPNVRRITTTEMSENRDGFLYYFDTEIVSLSPSSAANILQDSYLVADEGTYSSLGYRHVVEDPNFSYSMQETGFIDLPLYVLPTGSEDARSSLVRIVGSPIQVSYERADLVQQVQEFVDSASDRLLAAGVLARHFLPAYISYDAVYAGGSDPSVVTADVRKYVEQTTIETAVDVSEIERRIMDHGGNPDTPTKISATIYDWDRRMWVEFSENYLGGPDPTDTKVPYHGSPRVTFFMPGQDVSGLTVIPDGERVSLKRK